MKYKYGESFKMKLIEDLTDTQKYDSYKKAIQTRINELITEKIESLTRKG